MPRPIATFAIPNHVVRTHIIKGRRIDAIREWRAQNHELGNGVGVVPNLAMCTMVTRHWMANPDWMDIPLAICEGDYHIR